MTTPRALQAMAGEMFDMARETVDHATRTVDLLRSTPEKFFVLADIATKAKSKKPVIVSPIALKAVRWFDAIFEWERSINGLPPAQRLAVRAKQIAPPCPGLRSLDAHRARQAFAPCGVAKAMDYMLKRWTAFTCFLADGRICLSNNAAERALRCIALGRKAWLFAGSKRGGERAASCIPVPPRQLSRQPEA
jgi:transposase